MIALLIIRIVIINPTYYAMFLH